jgi:hypothetical protein
MNMTTADKPRRVTARQLVRTIKRLRIDIEPTDRAFFCGTTGSGKTTLALQGIYSEPVYTIFDPKADIIIPGVEIVETYNPRLKRQIIYEPEGTSEQSAWEAQCKLLYESRIPQIVYLDEVTAMSPAKNMPFYLGKMIRLGRGRGLGVWSASQRPVDVPNALLTESTHYFVGFLNYPPDIDKIVSMTTPRLREFIPTDFYAFIYYNKRTRSLIRITPTGAESV